MTVTDAALPASTKLRPDIRPNAAIASKVTLGRALFLLGIGLLWLTAMLWTLRSALAESYGSDSGMIFAAQNLFGPVTAALAVGCSAGLVTLTAISRLRSRRSQVDDPAWALRVPLGGISGFVIGVVNGGLALALISDRRISAVYAVCLAAASILGGLLAALPFQLVLATGLGATYATFLVKALLAPFTSTLAPLFGAEQTLNSADATGNRLFMAFSLAAGLVAGVIAYRGLRRASVPAVAWPGFMTAGAFAGLLALIAEAFTRLSAGKLVSPVTELAVVERTIVLLNGNARINSAMVMLFMGGLTATILLGRSYKRARV